MKKRLGLFLGIAISSLLLVTGCGNSEKSGSEEKEKTLKVVTDAEYPPFEFRDKGKLVGFDVDFIAAVAKEAGYKSEVEHVAWEPLFEEIKSKRADAAVSAVTINDERKQTYDFSFPYFISTNKILVPKDSAIKSAEDLKGKKVAVQTGTTGQAATESIVGKNNENIKQFENNNLAILELKSGGADAVVADNAVVEEYAKNNPDEGFAVVEDAVFEKEYYGVLFPKDSKLIEEFNKAINTLYENGTYAKIYKEWFGTEPDIETLKSQQ